MFRFVAIVALFLAGCPASADEVQPRQDQLFFPTGMALAPDQHALFVLNSNSQLAYDSGSVTVIDLEAVGQIADAWLADGTAPDRCAADPYAPRILRCNEAVAILADAGVRLGNFATELAIQTLAAGGLRLFVAVRGDPSLTWIDYDVDARELSCGDDGARFPECDDAHRLTRLRNQAGLLDIPDEPFGVYVNSAAEFVMLTHLVRGAISLADAPADGAPPVLTDALGGLFASDLATGVSGAAGVAGRDPDTLDDRVYVTSRSEARVQTVNVVRPDGHLPVLVPGEFFFMNRVLPSDDGRGIAFSGDRDRAYIINRDPPALQIFDTSLGEGGQPRNDVVGVVELCQQASNLAVADSGAGERVYVACFRGGQLWVIDPVGGVVEATIDVGRGPHGVAVSTAHQQVYVSNFLEDTVAVIDIRPGSATENHVVLRLGTPRQDGEDQ